jgi:hypothetical protein
MSLAVAEKLSDLRILWIRQIDGRLRMTWTDDASSKGRNGLKARCYGR